MSEIDVSGCKYWQMAHCPEGYTCKYNCCDCYYKQLQQLKYDVECAELRNKYDKEQFDNELQQLKAENEELKEKIKTYANVNEEDTKEWLKCRNALDEIEGIIKDGDICCNDCKRLTLNIIKQAKEGGKC